MELKNLKLLMCNNTLSYHLYVGNFAKLFSRFKEYIKMKRVLIVEDDENIKDMKVVWKL